MLHVKFQVRRHLVLNDERNQLERTSCGVASVPTTA